MSVTERPMSIRCDDETLLGVLVQPQRPRSVAVVFVVGGPQYRVGSHRQFVLLSRALAAAGYPSLRFDVRGMGDSEGAPRGFEALTGDIGAAVDAVCEDPRIQQVVLWGLCDGASAALLYLQDRADRRIAGVMLANPWVRTVHGLAKTQLRYYYTRRLLQPAFWSEALRGHVTRKALHDLVRNLKIGASGWFSRSAENRPLTAADFRQKMAAAWVGFGGPIMLLLSDDDYTAKEFVGYVSANRTWQGALARSGLERHDLPGVDHTFSSRGGLDTVATLCIDWLNRQFPKRSSQANTA